MDVRRFVEFRDKVLENVSKVIIGKDEVIELITIAFVCGGHVLLEDIPGVGKTTMVKAFAKTIEKGFKRIQFTPDLLPTDLTGINFYNQKSGDFEFRKGPLFTNIVLADEINRTTPRTQSSLLEAMEENQITVDGDTRKLEDTFMVLATQNPVESYGTFPLPEAQVDRFFMKVKIGYPQNEEEKIIIRNNINNNSVSDLESVVSTKDIEFMKENYKSVKVSEDILEYIMDIVRATREDHNLMFGVSPRGSMALHKASQVKAAFEGRDYVIPEDVKAMAPFVLNHRIIYKGIKKTQNIYEYIENLVNNIKVPLESL